MGPKTLQDPLRCLGTCLEYPQGAPREPPGEHRFYLPPSAQRPAQIPSSPQGTVHPPWGKREWSVSPSPLHLENMSRTWKPHLPPREEREEKTWSLFRPSPPLCKLGPTPSTHCGRTSGQTWTHAHRHTPSTKGPEPASPPIRPPCPRVKPGAHPYGTETAGGTEAAESGTETKLLILVPRLLSVVPKLLILPTGLMILG